MSPYSSYATSEAVQPPPTENEWDSSVRRAHIKSNRKAAKVLGVTIVCTPHVAIDRKASQVLGTPIIRTDWDTFACGSESASDLLHGLDTSPAKSQRRSQSRTKWLDMSAIRRSCDIGSNDRETPQKTRKVILTGVTSLSTTQRGRRHTVIYERGVDLMLSESSAKEWPDSPTSPNHLSDDASNAPNSPATSSTSSLTPLLPHMLPNPVYQRKKEMVRSATKSVQILGNEVSNVIKNHIERKNMGRIGWDD